MIDHLIRAIDIEATILNSGDLTGEHSYDQCPVNHSFGKGCYIREWNSPAGMLVVSKIHKVAHPFFLLKGEMSVVTDQGVERMKAPYYCITPPGTKRVLFTHTEVQVVTVHVTDETDLKKIESEVIATDVDQLELTSAELAKLTEAME